MMAAKPTYEELEQRAKELKQDGLERMRVEAALAPEAEQTAPSNTDPGNPYLVDGKYSIRDIIDIKSLHKTLEKFSLATGFTTGFLEYPSQEILIATGWRDVCTKFHRACPESAIHCKESNIYLSEQLRQLKELNIKPCENGLVDGATPIVIKGKYIAYLATGQVLFEKPDIERFKKQAQIYGYDVEKYLDALREVPVVSEAQFKNALSFLSELAVTIAETGLNGLQLKERTKELEEEINERKQAEEALRESLEFKETILLESPIGISIYDSSGQCISANDSIGELIGATKEQVLKQNYNNLKSWKLSGLLDKAKRAIKENTKKRHDLIVRTTFSKDVSLDCHLIPFSSEGQPHLLLMINDISERIQAEEALRESEEKYRNIFENVSDFLFFHDLEGNFIEVNSAFKKEYGFNEEELIYPNLKDMIHERYKSQLNEYLMRIKENGKDEGFINVITKAGRELVIEYKNLLIYDSKKEPIGVQGLGRDITDRIKIKKEKKALEKQLQQSQKMEAIGTLAGGIAHDFNNLLTGIVGRTSLLMMEIDSFHPYFEHLKGIEDYVKSGTRLTKQLLGFARGGKYEIKAIDLNELIKKENQMFGRTRKEIKIRENLERNLWTVNVDQGQIEQVVMNIYVNAWHAMPGGGDLFVQTENNTLDEKYTKPYSVEPGKYVKISVTDTGVGMDEATLQRIFDPFFTTKEMGRGTGLGLASAYGIIKNHNGFIDVYSDKGEGTTFNIYLPASEKEVAIEKEIDKGLVSGTETILLVDDEDMIIEIGQIVIDKLGYKVLTAKSGKKAIEAYKKNLLKIDMVILDMIMPDMSGGETYDTLKEINPEIKVLLSSGYSINGQATKILERGCNGFIQKPFTITDLSKKIREILDKG